MDVSWKIAKGQPGDIAYDQVGYRNNTIFGASTSSRLGVSGVGASVRDALARGAVARGAGEIDTGVVDSLKALDPEWPIREADVDRRPLRCREPGPGIQTSATKLFRQPGSAERLAQSGD
jgi:hypothetical protein